jgi:fimbrial chaperone protein
MACAGGRLALSLLLALAIAGPAGAAGGLALHPLRVDLTPEQRGAAVMLRNEGETRKTIEVEVMAWAQPHGGEEYAPTRALLASPPLFFLEPGASQTVRIGRPMSAGPVGDAEQAFRVFFREVPPAAPAGGGALRVAVRLGIPVFVAARDAQPALQWQAALRVDGTAALTLINRGTRHARAAEVRLLAADSDVVVARAEGFRYVLAGARQSWQLQPTVKLTPGAYRVVAQFEGGVREHAIALVRP